MMTLLARLIGRKRVTVMENQRALHLHDGRLAAVLDPGTHWLPERSELEWHDVNGGEFASRYERALLERLPHEAAARLTEFRTGPSEVCVVERDGKIHAVMGPDGRKLFWTVAGPWVGTLIDASAMPAVDPVLLRRLARAGPTATRFLTAVDVPEGHAGLMFVDGALAHRLAPGAHAYWTPGLGIVVKLIDLRRRAVEVSGQEVLTRDKVSVRVNVVGDYRVTDPVLAVTAVPKFEDALYRALQHAFRRMLGGLTLDAMLERKAELDGEVLTALRAEAAAFGVELVDVALKDVILPGDMRDILNRVVAAEKEAEANVIRRREETNATRSLLNTAKVMAENPVMLRLKELEALETIAGRVDRLTIHNGADGLMRDLVRLSDE